MAHKASIKILHGALDTRGGGDTVLRGVIDKDDLGIHPDSPALAKKLFEVTPDLVGQFRIDEYQREIITGTRRDSLVKAFVAGERVPDVELGMRGEAVVERNGIFFLHDPVFIVDGLQRISAAKAAINASEEELSPHLGATIYFNSNIEWERARFRTLNVDRARLSPNVHLRNLRPTHKTTAMLYRLTTGDPDFVLFRRVQWGQSKMVGEFLTALGLYRVVSMLHWQFGSTKSSSDPLLIGNSIEKLAAPDSIGIRRVQRNVMTFFQIIDDCWGIRQLVFIQSAPHIKQTFLVTLAELFTRYEEFWRDNQLFVDASTKRKIAKFPLMDSSVRSLIASSGSGNQRMLYQLLLEHVNRGRRNHRLTELAMPEEDDDEEKVLVGADE